MEIKLKGAGVKPLRLKLLGEVAIRIGEILIDFTHHQSRGFFRLRGAEMVETRMKTSFRD